jgi:hypothetical protein
MSELNESTIKHHFYTPKDIQMNFQGHPCSLTIRKNAAEN